MKKITFLLVALFYIGGICSNSFAQKSDSADKNYKPLILVESDELQTLIGDAVTHALAEKFASGKVKPDDVAATLIDLRDPNNLLTASFKGDSQIYPASVVKMFYMVALEQQIKDGKIKMTGELERGLKDMIEVSSNEATQYILDVITDTASGGELPEKEFKNWAYKRNAVNRYFASRGYANINVNQKTHCEDAYGREQQFRNYAGENRNMLTTKAAAKLMAEIALGRAVSPEKSRKMLELMKRDPFSKTDDIEDQAHGFTGIALINRDMKNAKLWSKAGWTSKTRHDAAYIETADGLKFVLVVFTENQANDRNIIPGIAGYILDNWKKN